ncbi:hypothetical protein PFISCL1PPCAC_4553, partial [Pristionchus fissidentatus]
RAVICGETTRMHRSIVLVAATALLASYVDAQCNLLPETAPPAGSVNFIPQVSNTADGRRMWSCAYSVYGRFGAGGAAMMTNDNIFFCNPAVGIWTNGNGYSRLTTMTCVRPQTPYGPYCTLVEIQNANPMARSTFYALGNQVVTCPGGQRMQIVNGPIATSLRCEGPTKRFFATLPNGTTQAVNLPQIRCMP